MPVLNFQIIVAFDVLEHIQEIDAIFKDIFIRLGVKGLFVFVCPVYDGPLGFIVRLLDKDSTHIHKKSRFWWLHLAKSTGFNIIEWRGIMRYFLPWRYYLHMRMMGLLKRIAPAIIVVCCKS